MMQRSWQAGMGLLVLSLAAMVLPAAAQRGGYAPPPPTGQWTKVGEERVSVGREDRDVIQIGRSEGRFAALKLRIRGGDVHVTDMRVVYANGSAEDLVVNQLIRAGAETRPLDLRGDARAIDRVELVYQARPGGWGGYGGRATAEVWGLSVADRGPPPTATVPPGYTELDIQEINLASPQIVMPVGREEGRHTKIRLRVLDAPVFIRRMTVTYGNKEVQEVTLRDALPPGGMTESIDLSGDRRFVEQVVVHLRPQAGGRARLQLLGDIVDPRRSYAPPPPPSAPPMRVPSGWVMFGSKQVGFQTETDVITVGRDIGRFSRVGLKVSGNDVFFREIEVVYARGETQRFPVNAEVRAGNITPPISLSGDRFIREIRMTYSARPGFRGQATVEVYGEYAESWVGERGDHRTHNDGWVLLGSQRADMVRTDNDVFQVGRRMGAFKAIRLLARGHAVTINSLTIIYANGEREVVPVPRNLRGGETTPPVSLRGRERFIEAVELSYRSGFNLRGEAVVEVWGQH